MRRRVQEARPRDVFSMSWASSSASGGGAVAQNPGIEVDIAGAEKFPVAAKISSLSGLHESAPFALSQCRAAGQP